MVELVAQRGLLARALFGREGAVLRACTDGLLVTGGGKEHLVAMSECYKRGS